MTLQNTRNRDRRPRGAAMLLVLIAVAMCTIMALSFLAAQEPTAVVASNIDRKTQARAIAESALKMAIDYVNEDADWRSDKTSGLWMTDVSLDGGTFTLTGIDKDDGDLSDDASEAVLLSVVATYNGVTHRVSAVVAPGAEAAAGTRLLLVVSDDVSPVAQDQSLQALFEQWGYTVTLIDDAATQSAYDAAVAVNDVIYVSERAVGSSVSTKLQNTSLGVVLGDGPLHDEFGLTTGGSTQDSTTAIDIAGNTHMITEGFSTGSLAIVQIASNIRYSNAILAAGVTTLADRTGAATEATIMLANTGATLHTGTAAGRRVTFPTGDSFDVANLTPEGQVILWRCLQWASGANAVPPMRIALYEFNEQPVADPTLIGHWKLDEEPIGGEGGSSGGEKIEVKSSSRIDSYDSTLGTYASQTATNNAVVTLNSTATDAFKVEGSAFLGGDGWIGAGGSPSNVFMIDGTMTGTQNVQAENIPLPWLTAPTWLAAPSGSYSRSSGVQTISSDQSYTSFTMTGGRINISGDVTIWVTGDFTMDGNSEIRIPEGSSLTLYTGGNVDLFSNAQLNGDTTGADRLRIYGYGDYHIDTDGNAIISGIVRTNSELHLKSSSQVYGKVLAWKKLHLDGSSQYHQDLRLGGFPAGVDVNSGHTSVGSSSSELDGDQAATPITIEEEMTITSITAYIYGDEGDVRYAIYSDNSGVPGSLIAQTNKDQSYIDESWQWHTLDLPSPTLLPPGTYWLALTFNDEDMRYRYHAGGSIEHQSNDGTDGFDADWSDSSSTGSFTRTISIYMTGKGAAGVMPPALDETATANDGTYVGDAAGDFAGFGDGGTSVEFDGDGDYVEIPHHASYLLDEGSVSMHYYPTSTTGIGPLFSKDAAGQGNGGHLYIYRNGTRIAAKIETTSDDPYGTGATISLQSGTGVVASNTWNHVTVTWGDGQFRLYADGMLVASANHLGGLGTTSGGTGNEEPIVVGANAQNSIAGTSSPLESDFFEGRIDDIRIYDVPVDATQAGNLASGLDPGSRTAPGYVIADIAAYGDPADMLIYDTSAINWIGGGGLQFIGDTIATTLGSASKVKDAIDMNSEFSVEILFTQMTPGSAATPSYLFGYSNDPAVHNFLIGQDDTNYEARVRDSATGMSGVLSPDLLSTTNLNDPGETHLVLSYTEGEVKVFVNGEADETRSTGGTLNNWDDTLLLVLGGAYDDTDHWNGTINRIAIYEAGFNINQARNVYNGEEPGDGSGGAGTARWDEED